MILEQLDYLPAPGRKADLLHRFETATHRIFLRHGFRPVGFFTTSIGKSLQEITYMLAWTSLAEREECWAAFLAGAEWQEIRRKTEASGPLVHDSTSRILRPTAFSPTHWFAEPAAS